ncbi:MAG: class I adenylate-forming enzyme family protein [Thermoanaerobaculales bacterium]
MRDQQCPLVRRFLALAQHDAARPIILGADGEILATRATLATAIEAQRAAYLPFVRPQSTVVLSLPNSLELALAFGALRLLGARVALVDAAAPAEELSRCARAVGASAVVATPDRTPHRQVAVRDDVTALTLEADPEPVALPVGTALLKLTSGSTGSPRAIALSVRQLVTDSVQILATMGIQPHDVTMAVIPLTHSYGIGNCLIPLYLVGLPLAFPTCALPAALAHTLAAAGVQHFPAVPAMIRALATLGGLPDLPALRVCLTAGAPLAPADAQAFCAATGHKVHVFYGCSECGGISYDRTAAPVHAPGAVGTPMDHVRVEVVDSCLRPLPPGQEGRVLVHSRGVALGTAPATEDADELAPGRFLTGDLGVQGEDEPLILTGRVAEFLNIAGNKVHPEEIRRALEEIPGVRSAVVAGLPDPHRGQLVAALVAVEPGAALSVHAVLTACRRRLAPHKVPRRVVIVDELPVSERGKLRKDAVMALLTGQAQSAS